MANLKRRPDKDLNHENWDDEDAPEEKGEFKRASDENLRGRRIIKGRRKLVKLIAAKFNLVLIVFFVGKQFRSSSKRSE
jgi:hypothetical protein